MGWAWSYCRHPGCDQGLIRATAREVIEGVQRCQAGHVNEPNVTRDELLIDLMERIEALEAKTSK
ncbi:hypothetical protein [Burkholderia ubonensis]|uniref:hypothetical protein n=1 Tax=Burkholderia ubonensis TaxID=101571 RepID=UPI000A61E9CE|nr:hypothetical protein [Burkholderia ubonensis]